MKPVDRDVLQAADLRHEQTLADVDLGQLRVGIGLAEVGPDGRPLVVHLAMPAGCCRRDFGRSLLLVEGFAVEIHIPAMMPVAVIQPASGQLQRVRVVVAEERVGQFDFPDAAALGLPIGDPLGALDEHGFPRCRAVGDAPAFVRAAARRLDPLAVRSLVDDHTISRLGDRRGLVDRAKGGTRAAGAFAASGLRDVDLSRPGRGVCQSDDGQPQGRRQESSSGSHETMPPLQSSRLGAHGPPSALGTSTCSGAIVRSSGFGRAGNLACGSAWYQ